MMIDDKQISQAAALYAEETWNFDEESFSGIDGFKAGARWMQQRFVKSIWHDAEEEKPVKGKPCIVEVIYPRPCGLPDEVECVNSNFSQYGWAEYSFRFNTYNVTRWCYVSDILPQKGGE